MAVLRTDIERALNELASQEEGMRFQGLAVVLGKKRWPELIAHQRKIDLGLDAYAAPSLSPDRIGKGLASSITTKLKKISDDVETAKKNFPELKMLLFVTPAKVGNTNRKQWKETIEKDHGIELHIIEREEIITLMMMPENASLCEGFLYLHIEAEPEVADLIVRTRRAAAVLAQTWARKIKGHPLINLAAMRLDPDGAESADILSLDQIDQALSQSRRVVLEGPAGRGKTTTLIQLAQRMRTAGTPFIVELPAWVSSRRGILEYIAGMHPFLAEGLKANDLARVQQTEPFLLMLNGWNEITESNSEEASIALRELERDFPSAGIIVATRTHHLIPPLPGAMRLRLLRLRRAQRAAYLTDRLGAKAAELRTLIDADPSLDELTCTPFILSEVASLFEAGAEIPSTKIGVLAEVLRLQEQREEHQNSLQAAPIFGRQTDYLKALATEMTRRGAVSLTETDARALAAVVTQKLAEHGQIGPIGSPEILVTLTAHHVLERVDYPQTTFQFEHQQFQEYYAALDASAQLLELRDDDRDTKGRFTADYVNDPTWAEPLRMIAETFAEHTGDDKTDNRNTSAGRKLVEMALAVDLVFAGELAQLCGSAVWKEVRVAVGDRLRAVHAIQDGKYRQYALAAMLATGAEDFSDIILPLLSGENQQTRFRTYRLWPDFQVLSLGPNWRAHVRGWSDEARADFVSELLYHRVDGEIAAFAMEDNSIRVKTAAASSLMWIGANDALTRVLESMDPQTFERVACQNFDRMPSALRPNTVAAMRKFIENITDHPERLRTALNLIKLGETGLDGIVKDEMAAMPSSDIRNLAVYYIKPVLEYLRKTDPAWVSEWVVTQVAEGVLHDPELWLPFATTIPDRLVEEYLQRLEREDFENRQIDGMVAVITACADANLAARLFAKMCELRRKMDAAPGQRHEFEWQVIRQLESVFRHLPDDIAAAGILSSVASGVPLDIIVAADLISKVARADMEPLRIANEDLKARFRAYLKSSVDLVLRQDDFNGEEKSDLASSIAQVGQPEDMADLVRLIRADIDRMRRGRAARVAGDRGPLVNGASMSYARWNIAAVIHLDPAGADQVLIDLLSEPEYLSDAAVAMARDFLPKPERFFDRRFRYDLMWAAREGCVSSSGDDYRRERFAAALNAEIRRLREQDNDGKRAAGLKTLAMALAAIDGRGSEAVVLAVIALPGQWDEYLRLETTERLLRAGVVPPATTAFALVDSILERTEKWMQDQDRHLLSRSLALCPFIDDPAAGIAKVRYVLGKRPLRGSELHELVTALGESRSDAAVDVLYELASDAPTFEQCDDYFLNALAALDTPRARELLLGFIDPDNRRIVVTRGLRHENVLVGQLTELAQHKPEMAARMLELCERDLPELNRHILSKVMGWLETPEALIANLSLIDDAKPWPVPEGVREQLETAFLERRPYEQSPNTFTKHARASNELRVRLFRMAIEDEKRRKSAFLALGQIEEWRLEHGRPTGEPRHPNLASGKPWPLQDPSLVAKGSSMPDRV